MSPGATAGAGGAAGEREAAAAAADLHHQTGSASAS